MKSTTKKIVEVILKIVFSISLILMCAEKEDGSIGILWSLGWMAALVISSLLLAKVMSRDKSETI